MMPSWATAIPPAIPRAALVTGGGRRLGRTIALTLAEAGFDVALHCNASIDDALATQAEIQALGRRAVILRGPTASGEIRHRVDGCELLMTMRIA